MPTIDLLERTFKFGIRTVKLCRTLPNTQEYFLIKNQLIRSATSIGANYEESQAASSRADFRNKVRISLREARECHYWLRFIKCLDNSKSAELDELLKEASELKSILGSIVKKTEV